MTTSAAAYALIYGDTGEHYFTQIWPGDPPNEYGTPPEPAPPPADPYVGPPTPVDLQRYLAWPTLDEEQQEAAQAHLHRATTLVRAYVRGRGLAGETMASALREVVVSVAARTMVNPTSESRVTAGQWSATHGQPDFTLQERLVLDGYRRRTA